MKTIIFVGASVPNLYGAQKLQERGFNCIIHEKRSNLTNKMRRCLPVEFLKKIDCYEERKNVIVLTEIKERLAKGLKINFNSALKVKIKEGMVQVFNSDNKTLSFDFLIINSGFKELPERKIKESNVFSVNYSVPIKSIEKHYAGNSLTHSVEQIDQIVEKIARL